MKIGTINFNELGNKDDITSCVLTAVIFPEEFNEKELEEYLQGTSFLPKGKNIIAMNKIVENVLGEDGRTDYLIEFDHPEIHLSPLGRFNVIDRNGVNWCKWTSDFIINYREDYIYD